MAAACCRHYGHRPPAAWRAIETSAADRCSSSHVDKRDLQEDRDPARRSQPTLQQTQHLLCAICKPSSVQAQPYAQPPSALVLSPALQGSVSCVVPPTQRFDRFAVSFQTRSDSMAPPRGVHKVYNVRPPVASKREARSGHSGPHPILRRRPNGRNPDRGAVIRS